MQVLENFNLELDSLSNLFQENIEYLRDTDKKIFIYGAQDTAKRKYDLISSLGKDVEAFFVDDKYYVPNQKINGKNVYSKAYVLNKYNDFVVVIGFYEYAKYLDVLKSNVFSQSIRLLFFYESEMFDKNYFLKNKDAFYETYNWLEDEKSRQIFVAYLKSRLSGNPEELIGCCTKPQYFDKIIKSLNIDTFIDCGAYDGYTITEFIKQTNGNYKTIYAFEADSENVEQLKKNHYGNEKIKVIDKGVWSHKTSLYFDADNTTSSKISDNGSIKIDAVPIDDYKFNPNERIFLKADIEGSELEMLKGAQNLIKNHKPLLAICCYHKKEDLIVLPQYLKTLNPDYKFYLRHHSGSSNETVLYAV